MSACGGTKVATANARQAENSASHLLDITLIPKGETTTRTRGLRTSFQAKFYSICRTKPQRIGAPRSEPDRRQLELPVVLPHERLLPGCLMPNVTRGS